MIEFSTIHVPRNSDGGFQDYRCDKCGSKTTVYIRVHIKYVSSEHWLWLCMGCLDKGIKMICDRMMEDVYEKAATQKSRKASH